ncbi:winged helix-turn-helix domain-containing protein [Desulfobulbus elongatus]|uniref:winged helix-turn-helix domain-containing protein n=1 Tax=Desulfobulbus elongatus TaxID=53332 RepID=UPI000554EAE0|nr:LysR family transcriptional regulator [Desulfobulbus elongatus]
MKKICTLPPECCVVIEMEQGATLGYRKAVLLNEIHALGSLTKAAKVSKIDHKHARELIREMNRVFSQPLVDFLGDPRRSDKVELTEKGMRTMKAYWLQFEPVWLSIIEERSRHY